MLVGILQGDSLVDYSELGKSSPIQLIVPPVLYLSDPSERLSPSIIQAVSSGREMFVSVRTAVFRNLFNPENSVRGFYAGTVPLDAAITSVEMRQSLGVQVSVEDFVPFFLIAYDGMRSKSSRLFLRSFSTALVSRQLSFQLALADQSNPEHRIVFDNFNPEASFELGSAGMIGNAIFS